MADKPGKCRFYWRLQRHIWLRGRADHNVESRAFNFHAGRTGSLCGDRAEFAKGVRVTVNPQVLGRASSGPRSEGRPRTGGLRPCRSASAQAPDRLPEPGVSRDCYFPR